MNYKDTSVVICCAGLGSRLGIGTTKALIDINGKPLILHQLELLKNFDDIRIVVGHQAREVIDVVKKYRNDIMFVFNYDYATTGPAASLKKALIGIRKFVITLDGDLVINKNDFQKFINYPNQCIVVSNILTEKPIFATVRNNKVIEFQKKSTYQWTGIAKLNSSKLLKLENKQNIYELIEPLLPLNGILLKVRGIDTKNDYINAIEWIKKGCDE